jgi:hypothetical protein
VDHPKIAAALALLLIPLVAGCASLRWSIQKSLRTEGAHIDAFPEKVAREYECAARKLPFVAVERHELVPPRVDAGGEMNLRLVYALCPAAPTEVMPGRLSERIRFKGTLIYRETHEHYELRPGRWVVDATVELPEDAEPGVYAYEIEFEGDAISFRESLTFVVRSP